MNKRPLVIISIILSVVFAAAHLFFFARFKLNIISLIGETDAGCVLLNDDDSELTFLRMSDTDMKRADGRVCVRKFFEDSDGGYGYNRPLNIVSDGGKIYLLNMREYFSDTPSEYEVCLLDFGRGKSEKIFTFSDEKLQNDVLECLLEGGDIVGVEYYIEYLDFDVDDEGITLFFEVDESTGFESLGTAVYSGKIIGGKLSAVERFCDMSGLSMLSAWITENGIAEINRENNLMFNGKILSAISDTRFYDILSYNDKKLLCKGLDKELYLVDTEEKTASSLNSLSDSIKSAGLDIADLYGTYKIGDNTAAVFTDGEQSRLFSPESGVYDAVYVESVPVTVIHSLIAAVIAWAAVWLIGLLIAALRTKGKICAKFAAAALPVMLGCVLPAYVFVDLGIAAVEADVLNKSLRAISQQLRALGLTDGIGDFDPNGEYAERIGEYGVTLSNVAYLNIVYRSEVVGSRTGVRFFGYIRDRGIFSDISDISAGKNDLDAPAFLPTKTAEKIRRAADSRSEIYCTFFEDGFEYFALVSPSYFGGDGSVNGVFVYTVSPAEATYNSAKLLRRLTVYMLILGGVIAVIFTLSAFVSLRGLKKLRRKSADYLAGEYSPSFEPKTGGTSDEIDVISGKFDELLSSVSREFGELDDLRRANSAYFSDAILKIFGKKSISTVRPGESARAEAYCVTALLPEKYESFDDMNSLLRALGGRLREYGAFVPYIGGLSFTVYSLEAEAMNILFFLREYDGSIIAAADKCFIDISFITAGGSARCRVTREDAAREEILMNTLINTRSTCAVTESAANSRGGELPRICVGMVDGEFIYDISDGGRRFDNSMRGELRRGIELYFGGDRTAAREKFVMILKRQQGDPVARYYIGLIDNAEQKEGAPL